MWVHSIHDEIIIISNVIFLPSRFSIRVRIIIIYDVSIRFILYSPLNLFNFLSTSHFFLFFFLVCHFIFLNFFNSFILYYTAVTISILYAYHNDNNIIINTYIWVYFVIIRNLQKLYIITIYLKYFIRLIIYRNIVEYLPINRINCLFSIILRKYFSVFICIG